MPISEEARLEMYKKLEEVLGMPYATTLVESLPPGGREQMATKQDLEVLGFRLEAAIHKSAKETEREVRSVQRSLQFGMLAAQATFTSLLFLAIRGFGG